MQYLDVIVRHLTSNWAYWARRNDIRCIGNSKLKPSPAASSPCLRASASYSVMELRATGSTNRPSLSQNIVLPWEFDSCLASLDVDSKRSVGAHPYAAFADADDNLFTGMFASVSKALKIALVPPDTSNPSSLKDFLIRLRLDFSFRSPSAKWNEIQSRFNIICSDQDCLQFSER